MRRTLLMLTLCCCCQMPPLWGQSPSTDSAVGEPTRLSGQVANATDAAIQIRFFTDHLSLDEQSFDVPIGPDGRYALQFQLNTPTVAFLSYYSVEVRLYLEPGDQLRIDFNAMNARGSLAFSGRGALHNRYLHQIDQAYRRWNNRAILYEIAQREALDFRQWLDRLHRQKLTYLREYDDRKTFSPTFARFARADIDYWWAYQLLRFRVEHAVANGQAGPLELPAEYYDFLNRVSISNDDALLNQNYRYFLEQYLAFRRENRGRQMPSNFYNQTLLVEIPSLLVLERPDKPPVLAEVRRGDRLKYLEERSETSTKVLIGEELREGHWHKIRTVDGVEGWIIGVGIRFETVDSAYVQRPDAYDGAALHLRGAALEYVVASKLYWRSHVENNAVFLAELRDFIARTQLPGYRKRLEVALAELTPKPSPSAADSTQINYGASHYLIVREAKVLSRKEAPLGTLSEAVVEGFGPAEEVQLREGISTAGPGVASKGKSRKRRRKESKSQGRKSKRKSKRKATEEGVVEPAEAIAALPAPAPVANNSSLPTTQTHPPSPTEEAPAYVHIDPQARHGDRLTRPVAIDLRTPLAGKLELVLHEEPIAFTERPCPLQAQSPTQYRGELRYAGIKTGYIAYRGERFDLYLEGDAPLRLSFDPATFGRSLRFSGPGSAANNWMLTIARLRRTGAATREAKIREAGPEEFSQYLGEQRRVFHAELTRYGAEFSLSTTFLAFARADIDYWWATQLLNYPWEHPLQKGLPAPMQLPDDYYAFFDELEMSNDRALPNANYAYFLDAFMDYQVQLAANAHRSEWEIAREQLRGQARYFYEASLLVRACKRGRAQQEGGRIAEFVEDCPYIEYGNLLRQVYNEAKGLILGEPAPGFRLQDLSGREVQLSDYAGKVVYLDFWASWCSPCLMQMRNSSQWKAEFADREVVFLYVSLDKDPEAWRSFVRRNGFAGVHLKSVGGSVYQSKVARLYRVQRLPAVYLIDQEGRIAYNSLAAGENGGVVDHLRRLLP